MSDLEAMIFSAIDRYLGGGTGNVGSNRYHERHGIVTSYDPDKYLAKVTFMPEGQESGWLPIETGHIGDSYGVAVGLQPGDGKKSGDQVIIRYQEGDLESGKIVQRVHSDDEKPPVVKSGEIVIWSKFKKSTGQSGLGDDNSGGDTDEAADSGQGGSGQQIYFKNDGSITWTDGNGGSHAFDGKGNYTLTCNNHTTTVNGDHSITVTGSRTETIGKDMTKTISGKRTDTVKKSWMSSATGGVWSWLTAGGDMSD